MPITKSARKSLAVSLRRRAENARLRDHLKRVMHRVTRDRLNETFSAIDKAVNKGIVHPNKAARLKSALNKKFGAARKAEKKTTAPAKKKKSADARGRRKKH